MKDIERPGLMYFKGGLLLLLGGLASAVLILENPGYRTALLLAIAVWAFARAYYFAFYVIEHYIDGSYKFAGLTSFAAYLWNRRKAGDSTADSAASVPDRQAPSQTPHNSDNIG